MASNVYSFLIRTEIAPAYLGELLLFIYREYLVPLHRRFTNVRRWFENGREVLAFTAVDMHGFWYVDIEVAFGNPIEVKMFPFGDVPKDVLSRLKDDLIIAVQLFEEKMRQTTIYFAWVPEARMVPEKTVDRRRKLISRIFLGNMLVFFMIFIIMSYVLFITVTEVLGLPIEYYPLILVVLQFLTVLFSDKIVATMGDWTITPSSPYVHILQYHLSPEQFAFVKQNFGKERFLQMKKEIYDRTLSLGQPLTYEVARDVFHRHGLYIKPENLVIRTIDVYSIVKSVAEKFGIPIPKIMISNIIVPNAAATGPTPRLGLVLITTGLLVQLDEDEIYAVVGHELSHVKRRDPLALSILVNTEYLLRVYWLWNILYFFGLFYFFLAISVIYFIAKFFEARADLESAINLGTPEILANALRKIGYRRIQMERSQGNWLGTWFGMNPHPPVSFRVKRLESIENLRKIRHPFLQSIRDCIEGLLEDIKRI
ncbi:MAG: M48 family metalloprotease [Nitrososphaerota archaeon]|nr:M48 family metalloprotease [Candidatus Bathyarchaeota archaeon]MDW8048388.1 M48 family metalloprotease [Nitrososphaerota archaeon]